MLITSSTLAGQGRRSGKYNNKSRTRTMPIPRPHILRIAPEFHHGQRCLPMEDGSGIEGKPTVRKTGLKGCGGVVRRRGIRLSRRATFSRHSRRESAGAERACILLFDERRAPFHSHSRLVVFLLQELRQSRPFVRPGEARRPHASLAFHLSGCPRCQERVRGVFLPLPILRCFSLLHAGIFSSFLRDIGLGAHH